MQEKEDKIKELISSAKSDYDKGLAYSFGDGVSQNHNKALEFFMKSAEQGYAPARYRVGVAYAYGEGTEKNMEKAAYWYEQAAKQSYDVAQRNLGMMYINGEGVEEDKPRALAWYSVLADKGNVMDIRRRDVLEKQMEWEDIEKATELKKDLMSN